uniref:Candidate secreted effector n=1 Tax=Meloidogyne incognita TaxID=6306 RepID=A0A914KWR9_MELIC
MPSVESGGGVAPAGGGDAPVGGGAAPGTVDGFTPEGGGAPGFGGPAGAPGGAGTGGAPGFTGPCGGFPAPKAEGIAVFAIPDFSPIFDFAVFASSSVLDFVAAVPTDLVLSVLDLASASAPGSRGLSIDLLTGGLSFPSFVLLKN